MAGSIFFLGFALLGGFAAHAQEPEKRRESEVALTHGADYRLLGGDGLGRVARDRLEYRSWDWSRPRTDDPRTAGLEKLEEASSFIQTELFRGTPSGTPQTGELSHLERIEIGMRSRDWLPARPADTVKQFFEGGISAVYLSSSDTFSGTGFADFLQKPTSLEPKEPQQPKDPTQTGQTSQSQVTPSSPLQDYHRTGLIVNVRRGARFDLGPCVSVEASLGAGIDTLELDRGFGEFLTQVSLHTAADNVLDARRPQADLTAGYREAPYFNGAFERDFFCRGRLRAGDFSFDITANRRESVNEDLTKGLEQPGTWFYTATMGVAF